MEKQNSNLSNEIVGILLSPIEVLSEDDERISLLSDKLTICVSQCLLLFHWNLLVLGQVSSTRKTLTHKVRSRKPLSNLSCTK